MIGANSQHCYNIGANNYNTNSTRNNNLSLWSCWQPPWPPYIGNHNWQPPWYHQLTITLTITMISKISFKLATSAFQIWQYICINLSSPLTKKPKGSPETSPELGTLSESQPTDIQSIQPHFWYQFKWAIYHTLTIKSKLDNWNFAGMSHMNTNWNWHLWHL